jgi:hypothetical protein
MKTVKLTVSLSEEVVNALKEMATEDGTSVTEQLRRAVSTQKWLHEVRKERGKLLVARPTGETQEVVFVGG